MTRNFNQVPDQSLPDDDSVSSTLMTIVLVLFGVVCVASASLALI